MVETIHIMGEGGVVHPHDLPLPEGIAGRLARGHLRRVNPDGTLVKTLVVDLMNIADPAGISLPGRPPVHRPGRRRGSSATYRPAGRERAQGGLGWLGRPQRRQRG